MHEVETQKKKNGCVTIDKRNSVKFLFKLFLKGNNKLQPVAF